MPTATYIALANTTLTSQASVTFSSIPATYRDLVLVCSGTTSVNANLIPRLNGDSGSNYSWVYMMGVGSGSGTSGSNASSTSLLAGADAYWISASPSNTIFNFMDYSATDKHKTVLVRNDNSTRASEAIANRWANTSAITSIAITLTSGTFTSGTMSLYGIVS